MKNKQLFIAVQVALFTVAVSVSAVLAQTTIPSDSTATAPTGGTGTAPTSGTGTPPPSGTGNPPPPSGTGTGTPPPSGTGTGTPPPSGTGTGTPPPSGTGTGTPPPSGTGTGTPPPSGTGTGTPPPSGTGTGTPPPSGTGTGTPPPSGTGTGTPPPSGTGTGTPPPSGTGTGTPPPSGTGTGTPPPSGIGTGTLPLSGTGTGTPPPSGTGTGTPPPSGTGTGSPPPSGTGTGTLPPSGTGTGTPPPSGTGTGSPPPSGTGTGSPPPSGTGTGSPPPSGTGTGSPPPSGTGTGSPPPSGTGTGSPPPSGTGSSETPTTSMSPSTPKKEVPTVPYSPAVEQTPSTPVITNNSVSASLNASGRTFAQEITVEPTGQVVEGNFTVPVENHGIISRSTFNPVKTTGAESPPSVNNHGSISQSTFNAPIENQGLISNSTLTAQGTIHGGMVTGTMTSQGGTLANVEFVGIQLRGGTLEGTITNNSKVGGVIQDVQLAPQATLTGGKVGGTITAAPDSVIQNVRLVADTHIQGGILKGKIQGDPRHPAQLSEVEFAPGTQLSHVTVIAPAGLPDDVTIGPGVTVLRALPLDAETVKQLEEGNLGELPPATFQQLEPEQVEKIPPTAFANLTGAQFAQFSATGLGALHSEQVANIPPVAFSSLGANQVGGLPKDSFAMMAPSQFNAMSKTALAGLTAEQIEGLSVPVVHGLTSEQLQALPSDEVKQMSGPAMGRLLVHLNTDEVSPTDVTSLLPDDWKMDTQTGALTPPNQTPLTFQELPPAIDLPAQVTLPTMPNLNTSFGIGGAGGQTALEGFNEILPETNAFLTVSQDQYGILHFQGGGDKFRRETSLMPMSTGIQQVSTDTSAGLQRTEGGFVQVTTSQNQQFTMVPAPKDPADLSEVTSSECVMMGEQGDVFLSMASNLRSSAEAREVVIFDEVVEPAPTDVCEETADGETLCDFEQADSSEQPGIHDVNVNTRAAVSLLQRKKVVYSDGTSQIVYPTVLSPQTFIEEALKLDGMEKIVFQANGTFKMTQDGTQYLVYHNFSPQTRTVADTETVATSLVQKDNHLIYTVEVNCSSSTENGTTRQKRAEESSGSSREVMEFDSVIEPVSDSCEEIDGETVCESEESSTTTSTGE